VRGEGKEEGSASFLKKRSKKLLPMGFGSTRRQRLHCKSFLVLFFKKEPLPSKSE
jgi:hypothetical protein